jgi:DUF4097 and DUF4098 domain-containing protein YvlB
MHNIRRYLLAIFVLTLAASAQNTGQGQEFHWKGTLSPENVVFVKNVNGNIEADLASGNEVEVTAEKSGEYADEAKIQMIQLKDGVMFCVVYPGWFNQQCEESHSLHQHGEGPKVHFTVHVPENLRFTGENVNGSVIAENMGRFVKATSVNGKVRVSTKSCAELSSVNGSLEAKMGRADWPGTLKLGTVNGSISLEMPADLSTDVKFTSVNGRLRTEFPMNVEGNIDGHSVSGQIGSGGRELKIETVNGSAEIRRGGV